MIITLLVLTSVFEFLPMAVTQDMIIGSEYDELQVEYVVAYAITEQL